MIEYVGYVGAWSIQFIRDPPILFIYEWVYVVYILKLLDVIINLSLYINFYFFIFN